MKFQAMPWLRLAGGVIFGIFGVFALTGKPNWLLGIPLQAISCWLLLTSLPLKASIPVEKKAKPAARKPVKAKKKSKIAFDRNTLWVLVPILLTFFAGLFWRGNKLLGAWALSRPL